MGSYVEAKSLSDVMQIASNPPRSPRNPLEKQRSPLILYIARVPGSKDIIFTTLKPQLKNVTAEDVESSLYYFHQITEDEPQLLADEQDNALSVAASELQPPWGVEDQPLRSGPLIPNSVPLKLGNDSGRSNPVHYEDPKTDGSAKSFSFKIIRRDPASGSQWNIGSVSGEGHNRGMKAMSNAKKPNFDISVLLTTPGYTSLPSSQTATHIDGRPQLQDRHMLTEATYSAHSGGGFVRQVCMEGTSFFARASKQHRHSQSDSSDLLAGAGSNSTAGQAQNKPKAYTADSHDTGSKGYVFLSPWDGRCKFTTGGGGRSLRCKHTLPKSPSSRSAVFESSGSADVSELRFNLPHSELFKPYKANGNAKGTNVDSGRFSIPVFGHIRNKLSQGARPPLPHRPHPRPHPTSYAALYPSDDEHAPPLPPRVYDDPQEAWSSDEGNIRPIGGSLRSHPEYTPWSPNEEDERLDLSLGRERAGGGNRGKRAKLGKLIIHDEGYKMLDLVVAANMGVWWSVFDTR